MNPRLCGLLLLAVTGLGASAAEARCNEPYPIVGRGCSLFGHWGFDDANAPRSAVGLSFGAHFSSLDNISIMGTAGKTMGGTLPSSIFKGLRTTSLSFGPRLAGFVAGPLYLGVNLQGGPSILGRTPQLADGSVVSTGAGFFFQAGVIVGLLVPWESLHPFSLRTEVLLGGRIQSFTAPVPPSAVPDGLAPAVVTANASTWVIEPRIWVDLWKNPWLTFSVAGGKNLLRQGDDSILFAITGHLVPFDFPKSWW